MTMPDLLRMDFPALIAEFEKEIIYDCHSLAISFGRSNAKDELITRERKSLRPIIEHLSGNNAAQRFPNATPELLNRLATAWGMLLAHIKYRIDGKSEYPKFSDSDGWTTWAKQYAA